MDDEEAMVGGGANEGDKEDPDLNMPPKPEPPADFDEETVRQKITDKFLKIRFVFPVFPVIVDCFG